MNFSYSLFKLPEDIQHSIDKIRSGYGEFALDIVKQASLQGIQAQKILFNISDSDRTAVRSAALNAITKNVEALLMGPEYSKDIGLDLYYRDKIERPAQFYAFTFDNIAQKFCDNMPEKMSGDALKFAMLWRVKGNIDKTWLAEQQKPIKIPEYIISTHRRLQKIFDETAPLHLQGDAAANRDEFCVRQKAADAAVRRYALEMLGKRAARVSQKTGGQKHPPTWQETVRDLEDLPYPYTSKQYASLARLFVAVHELCGEDRGYIYTRQRILADPVTAIGLLRQALNSFDQGKTPSENTATGRKLYNALYNDASPNASDEKVKSLIESRISRLSTSIARA